jgi:hypothetical protein
VLTYLLGYPTFVSTTDPGPSGVTVARLP